MIVTDIEVRIDLDQAGTDLTKHRFTTLSTVVRDHLDDGGFNIGLIREGILGLLFLCVRIRA